MPPTPAEPPAPFATPEPPPPRPAEPPAAKPPAAEPPEPAPFEPPAPAAGSPSESSPPHVATAATGEPTNTTFAPDANLFTNKLNNEPAARPSRRAERVGRGVPLGDDDCMDATI